MANHWFTLEIFNAQRYKKTRYSGNLGEIFTLKKRNIEHSAWKIIFQDINNC